MAEVTYALDVKNGTATFQYGNYVESFDTRDIGMMELYERIKYAAITAGITLNEDTLESLLREVKGLNTETPTESVNLFVCDTCGKSFKGPQGLGSHKSRSHGIKGKSHKTGVKSVKPDKVPSKDKLSDKHLMVVRYGQDEILFEDVSHGYPGIAYYVVRAEDNGRLGIYKLEEKEIKSG